MLDVWEVPADEVPGHEDEAGWYYERGANCDARGPFPTRSDAEFAAIMEYA